MPLLLAAPEFGAHAFKTRVLGIDKPLQVERIIPVIHLEEAEASSLA
jgi:hypothetical protein